MTEGSAESGPRNLFASMQLVFSSSYLRAIAAVICISSLVTTLTGWQFLALMQQFLVKKDAIAAFYGNFNFYAGILSLFFQLGFTTRFLRRFGIGTALFVLPVTVLLGSTGLAAFGTLGAAVALKAATRCSVIPWTNLPPNCFIFRCLPGSSYRSSVHRYRNLAPGRRPGWVDRSDFCHYPAPGGTSNELDCAAAGNRLAGCGRGCAATVCRYPEESISQHRVDAEQASTSVLDRSTAELLTTKLSYLIPTRSFTL